jgi:hypothetical protein
MADRCHPVARGRAFRACGADDGTVRGVWWAMRRAGRPVSLAAAVAATAAVAACGSGDSTVAKTPGASSTPNPSASSSVRAPTSSAQAAPTSSTTPPPDPCALNLAAPAVAQAISELPRDPRSDQGWSAEPLAGNYNECAQLSAVIVKANTNADNPNTRAVMFHLGKLIPQGVPDTFGFNGIDTTQSTGDTVALTYSSGVEGLDSVVKFRWNGNGVELISNTAGG